MEQVAISKLTEAQKLDRIGHLQNEKKNAKIVPQQKVVERPQHSEGQKVSCFILIVLVPL